MNYYIQGNKEKADQIRAAFEKFGYDVETWRFTTGVYYTLNGRIVNTNIGSNEHELILNNPDYKELPIGPMFKVGDWVVKKDGGTFYGGNYAEQITLIEVDEKGKRIWLSSTTYVHDDDIRLWTIQDANDGDVLSSIRGCLFIYDKYRNQRNDLLYYYAGIDGHGDFVMKCPEKMPFHFGPSTDAVPAAKEQRDLLFAKMREAGYEWDADKKELRKIRSHYDIANLHAGMPVLVRNSNESVWVYLQYSHRESKYSRCFNAGGQYWYQCIPFNEDTKHLLGATDMCPEEYINW